MIHVNRHLENNDDKLLNPSPTRSTFIPNHIIVDTAALIDLVVGPTGVPLPEVLLLLAERIRAGFPANMDKGKLYANPCTLFPDRDRQTFPADFKSHIWAVLSGVGTPIVSSMWTGLKFNNVVTTNGYKADAHYVSPERFYLDRYKGDKIPKDGPDEQFSYVHHLPKADREELLESNRAYADPGKGNILYLSDGVKGGKRLRYTAVQRRSESTQKRNRLELEAMLRHTDADGCSYAEHLKSLSDDSAASRKSSTVQPFVRYLALRLQVSVILRPFFHRLGHRRRRYRALLGRKSTEDKLIHNIERVFGPDTVIFWGNWGRNRNLKNQPPTPGIGLRRQVAKRLQTITYDERMSSSLCFECESPVSHPKTRSFHRVNRSGFYAKVTVDIHHLLRCENEKCTSRWWERDNLGSMNGMKIAEYALTHGKSHPSFSGTKSRVTSRKRKQTTANSTVPGSGSSTKRFTVGGVVSPDSCVA